MIHPVKKPLLEALKEISKYQKGEVVQIKTNRPWLDHQGGILPQSILLIAGASFSGKSTELESLKSDIMNVGVNSEATNYTWLSLSLEMTMLSTTLRDVRKMTKKNFGEILTEEFNEYEKGKIQKYFEERSDGRFFISNDPLPASEMVEEIEGFLKDNVDKKAIFVDVDHAALIKANSSGKKGAIDDFVEGINELKNKYKNVVFVILTQLNRSILSRIQEKSNDFAIQRSDIYQSDSMFHISDYIYGLQNPYYFHVEEYRKVKPDKYPHLNHRFTEEDKNGKVSLITEGCIFVEVLKDRTADLDYVDIYTIEIKPITSIDHMPLAKVKLPVFKEEPRDLTKFF